jgi:hypothetical protein
MIVPEINLKKPKSKYLKPEAVKELEYMANEAARIKHPGMPYLAPRLYRDDSSNGLTSCITTYLRLLGVFVSRVNNTGIYDTNLHRYRPGTSRKGLPDVIATYHGKSIMIEVKYTRDHMSEDQKRIRQEHEQSGGLYYVAHNFTGFKEWFDKL